MSEPHKTTPYAPGYCHHADWEAECARRDAEQEERMTQKTTGFCRRIADMPIDQTVPETPR